MGNYYGAYLFDPGKSKLIKLQWDNSPFAIGELIDNKPGSIVIKNRGQGLGPDGGYKPYYQRWTYKNGQMMPIEK